MGESYYRWIPCVAIMVAFKLFRSTKEQVVLVRVSWGKIAKGRAGGWQGYYSRVLNRERSVGKWRESGPSCGISWLMLVWALAVNSTVFHTHTQTHIHNACSKIVCLPLYKKEGKYFTRQYMKLAGLTLLWNLLLQTWVKELSSLMHKSLSAPCS